MRRIIGVMFAAGLTVALALPSSFVSSQDRANAILVRKWEYKIQERVYLPSPSGWHSQWPWLVSSPAIGDLGMGSPDLEVVTGTEEGYFEWFPNGQNSGRYIAVDARGRHVWDYRTENNAGRASPAIVDLNGDGSPECTGGSTSGWMVHAFDAQGARRWRFPVDAQLNVLAAPSSGDLTDDPGLETVAVALDGTVYCLTSTGKLAWKVAPGSRGHGAAACAAVADTTGDGKPEVIVTLPGEASRTWCLDGANGRTRWGSDSFGSNQVILAAPAVVPRADPCWRQSTLGRSSGSAHVIAAAGNTMRCFDGQTGKEVWSYSSGAFIASSPAVGDVDGDGGPDVVFGDGRDIVCLNAYNGKRKWKLETGGAVYSSPALADRGTPRPHRLEWPMYRHDAARTGFYGFLRGPLAVYIGSDDGFLHVLDGRTGERIDKFSVKFPDLIIVSGSHGSLKFMSSPSVADIDGNGTLEVVFTLVDRVWCLEDRASAVARPRDESAVSKRALEPVKKNTAATRNHFAMAQVVHTGGWNPPVPVHEKLLEELAKRANLTAMNEMVPVSLRDDDVARFPFLYLTGHEALTFGDDELKRLRGHLERGGLLFAEACCNAEPFERSARAIAEKLSMGPLERLRNDHPIFTKVYDLREMKVARKGVPVEFWGIVRNGRVVFLFTNIDFGCSWGNTCCSSGCTGVSSEDSYRMLTNIVVYSLLE